MDVQADPAELGEFQCVAQEVVQHLAQPARVAHHPVRHRGIEPQFELQALVAGAQAVQVAQIARHLRNAEFHMLELDAAGLDFAQVEQVVDQAQQRLGAGVGQFDIAPLLRQQGLGQQQPGHAQHAVERRAHLMAHGVQELGLGPVGRLGCFLCLFDFGIGALFFRDVAKAPDPPEQRPLQGHRTSVAFEYPAVLEFEHVERLRRRLVVQGPDATAVGLRVLDLRDDEVAPGLARAVPQAVGNLHHPEQLPVVQQDLALPADHQDAVCRRIESRAGDRRRARQLQLGQLADRDVLVGAGRPQGAAAGVAPGHPALALDPDHRPVIAPHLVLDVVALSHAFDGIAQSGRDALMVSLGHPFHQAVEVGHRHLARASQQLRPVF